jgi:hypothetical protein
VEAAEGRKRPDLEPREVAADLILGRQPKRAACLQQLAGLAQLEPLGGGDHGQHVALAVPKDQVLGRVARLHPRCLSLRRDRELLLVLDQLEVDPLLIQVHLYSLDALLGHGSSFRRRRRSL